MTAAKLGDGLRFLDVNGVDFTFWMSKDDKFKSMVGGVIFICISSVALFSTCYYTMQMFAREQPQILSQKMYQNTYTPYNLDSTNFMFATNLDYGNATSLINRTDLFNIQLTGNLNVRNESGYFQPDYEIPLGPCTLEYFKTFTKAYHDIDASNLYLCPPPDFNFTLAGEFVSSVFNYIRIGVRRCVNGTKPNIICKSKAEQDAAIQNLRFHFSFRDNSDSPMNYNQPFTPFFNQMYWQLDPLLIKKTDLMMKTTHIFTDDNIMYSDSYEQVSLSFDQEVPQLYQTYDEYIFKAYVRLSPNIVYARRQYMKVPDVCSKVIGLLESVAIFLAFIAHYYTGHKKYEWLINKMFHIRDMKKINRARTKRGQSALFPSPNNSPESGGDGPPQNPPDTRFARGETEAAEQLKISQENLMKKRNSGESKPGSNPTTQSRLSFREILTDPLNSARAMLSSLNFNQNNGFREDLKTPTGNFFIDVPPSATVIDTAVSTKKNRKQSLPTSLPSFPGQRPSTCSLEPDHGPSLKRSKRRRTYVDYGNSLITRENFDPRKRQINFNFWLTKLANFNSYRQKKEVYQKASKLLQQYFDVEYIFEKLIEIEKLKKLLFTKEQLMVFENTPRPEIHIEGDQFSLTHNYIEERDEHKWKIEDVADSFVTVQEMAEKENDGLSLRLLEMLDPTFKASIQLSRRNSVEGEQYPGRPTNGMEPEQGNIEEILKSEEDLDEEIIIIEEEAD